MDFSRVAGFLVPSLCPLCRQVADPVSPICGDCMRELNRSVVLREDPPEGVDQMVSCADHDGIARELVAAFKFRHLTGLAPLISGYMVDAAGPLAENRLIVPVPPARFRTWLRGFDPVGRLAREMSEISEAELPHAMPVYRKGSGRQRGRNRAGRLGDPPDIRPREDAGKVIGGRDLLLVDDVMTTGATLTAGSGALRLAGARSVSAITFTRRL
ncbi:MAG: ComF family protein [Thermoleophilales bacterium]|nr:ComF family protein [Thermoleophilales bacterium]